MARIRVDGGGSGAPIVKWAQYEAGQVIEGTYGGCREGRFGLLADMDTADGPLTLPMPTVLERQLSRVRVGAVVTVQYDGLQHNARTKRDFHAFTVFVADAADLLPATPQRRRDAAAPAAAADDDRAPF